MSRIAGRRPAASGQTTTAGCFPVAGWKNAASQLPSAVLISTSRSLTATAATAGWAAAPRPVATESATKSRRERSIGAAGVGGRSVIVAPRRSGRGNDAPRRASTRRGSLVRRAGDLGEVLEHSVPTVRRAERFAHRHRVGAVRLEAAVLEVDPRRAGVDRSEADVDFGVEPRIELELRVQLPDENDPAIGLPDEHLPPHALDAVDAALVPAAARPRLDHDRGAVGEADVVRRQRPPRLDPRREDLERERDRRGDGDGLADRDLGGARERWLH